VTYQSNQLTSTLPLFQGWHKKKINFAGQIEHLLAVGLEYLELDVAIMSHVYDSTYTVEYFVGEGLSQRQVFDLGLTYCSITTKRQQEVVAIHHMGISEYFRHPCYEAFQLESYIGTPILLKG